MSVTALTFSPIYPSFFSVVQLLTAHKHPSSSFAFEMSAGSRPVTKYITAYSSLFLSQILLITSSVTNLFYYPTICCEILHPSPRSTRFSGFTHLSLLSTQTAVLTPHRISQRFTRSALMNLCRRRECCWIPHWLVRISFLRTERHSLPFLL